MRPYSSEYREIEYNVTPRKKLSLNTYTYYNIWERHSCTLENSHRGLENSSNPGLAIM